MSRRIPRLREDAGTGYANRVPQRQSLYDWAPGSDDEDLFHELLARAEMPTFAPTVRPPQSRHLDPESQRTSHSRSRFRHRDDDLDGGRPSSWTGAGRSGSSPHPADYPAPTEALVHSFEQHRRYNARARSTLQHHVSQRDRQDHDSGPNASAWARPQRSELQNPGSPYPTIRNPPSQADFQAAYRQLFVENCSLARLKSTIRYLSALRHCATLEEGLAVATGLAMDEACTAGPTRPLDRFSKLSDLIIDTATLPAIAECSWLTPGTVFAGSQQSPRRRPPTMLLHRHRIRTRDRHPESRVERFHPEQLLVLHERQRRRSNARVGTYRDRLPVPDVAIRHGAPISPLHPHLISGPLPPQPHGLSSDHWPVTITLHDISLDTLKLSGTMTASHLPERLTSSSSGRESRWGSMKSFFEGEIIDFRTHSLETETFATEDGDRGIGVDARYWRGVGPFRELWEKDRAKREGGRLGGGDSRLGTDDDTGDDMDDMDDNDDNVVEDAMGGEDIVAAHLRSRSWVEGVLLRDWILMRWKEKCFIEGGASKFETEPRTEIGAGGGGGVGFAALGANPTTVPTSWGLSISGFYYVAMRRQTGEIHGLYYDRGSLPFQILELRPHGGGPAPDSPTSPPVTVGGPGVKARFPVQQFR